jgi:hypothetical protein
MRSKLQNFWLWFQFVIFYWGFMNNLTHDNGWMTIIFGICFASVAWELLKTEEIEVKEEGE